MARNVGKLAVVVSASAGGLMAGLSQAQRAIQSFGSMAGTIAGSVGAAFGGLSLIGAGKWALGLATSMEQTQAQFKLLIGDAKLAETTLSSLKQFDLRSTLSFQPIVEATSRLTANNMAAADAVDIVTRLGDISKGNTQSFITLADAIAKTASAQRLMGDEANRLSDAGLNPLVAIAKKTGESVGEVRKRMEAGKVSFEEVRQAIIEATSAGGRFFGMMEQTANTTAGRFDRLQSKVEAMATSIGERMLPAAMSLVVAMESIVGIMDKFGGASALATAQVAAFAAGFLLTVTYAGRIVAAIRGIITAIRAMTTAQVIFQALAGPKGWATIVAGLVVAAGAVAALEVAFGGVEQQAAAAGEQTRKAVEETGKLAKPQANDAAAIASQKLSESLSEAAKRFDVATAAAERHASMLERGAEIARQFEPPETTFATTVQELNALVASGAITGDTFAAAFQDAANKLTEARNEAAGLNAEIQGTGAALANTSQGFAAMAQARLAGQRIEAQAQAAEANRLEIANLAAAAGAAIGPQQQAMPQFGGVSSMMADKFGLDLVRLMTDSNAKLGELVTETKREKKAVEVANVELY